jgi:hypothetical protein
MLAGVKQKCLNKASPEPAGGTKGSHSDLGMGESMPSVDGSRFHAPGKTDFWYSSDCAKTISWHGMETMRVGVPASVKAAFAAASTQKPTSLPLLIKMRAVFSTSTAT